MVMKLCIEVYVMNQNIGMHKYMKLYRNNYVLQLCSYSVKSKINYRNGLILPYFISL